MGRSVMDKISQNNFKNDLLNDSIDDLGNSVKLTKRKRNHSISNRKPPMQNLSNRQNKDKNE